PTAKTDMEALRNVFDTNHDGLLTIDDEGWQHFGIWQDINHDGISQADEYKSLIDMNVSQIDLNTDGLVENVNGNTVHGSSLLHYEDGSTVKAYDVTLSTADVLQVAPSLEDTLNNVTPAANDAPSSAPVTSDSSTTPSDVPTTNNLSIPDTVTSGVSESASANDAAAPVTSPADVAALPPLANDAADPTPVIDTATQELAQQQHQQQAAETFG
ncbi:MAG: hypothetical protein AB7I18_14400, partial [Candidatus Berkiella sp.]